MPQTNLGSYLFFCIMADPCEILRLL